jgi:hypothetical protein
MNKAEAEKIARKMIKRNVKTTRQSRTDHEAIKRTSLSRCICISRRMSFA